MADNTPESLKSVEERDREWLANVYRGDKEKDLTPRRCGAPYPHSGLMDAKALTRRACVIGNWSHCQPLVGLVPAVPHQV